MSGVLKSGRRVLRRLGIYAFAHVNPGDVSIRHHYTGERFRLHSFRHKGYWFHGRRRERSSMEVFARLIRPGDCVLEAGGHIGYISLYLAHLVGREGTIHVFEPGPNNIPYLAGNLGGQPNARLVPRALGSAPGTLTLYVEDLTGQNNSLVPNFEVLAANERRAVKASATPTPVEVTTIDSYAEQERIRPDFMKIDVEGFEWEVLSGARKVIAECRPVMMVEVQTHQRDIADLLRGYGYRLYEPNGRPATEISTGPVNIFALPPGREFPRHGAYPQVEHR